MTKYGLRVRATVDFYVMIDARDPEDAREWADTVVVEGFDSILATECHGGLPDGREYFITSSRFTVDEISEANVVD